MPTRLGTERPLNTGGRGGARPGSGPPKKSLIDQLADESNKKIQVLDIPEPDGVDMPDPHSFLSSPQSQGNDLCAEQIYKETWDWLRKVGCAGKVHQMLLERYAMSTARWIQCEEITSSMGFLARHPTTGKSIPSPFVAMAINFQNQAGRYWNEIFQIVRENCSTDYSGGPEPGGDMMERLLRARDKK